MTALFYQLVVRSGTRDCLACQATMEQVGISLNLGVQIFTPRWVPKTQIKLYRHLLLYQLV